MLPLRVHVRGANSLVPVLSLCQCLHTESLETRPRCELVLSLGGGATVNMAAGAKYKVCLDDLLSSVPSQEKLDTQISDDVHLEEIGAKILNWKGLRAYLGLSRQEEEAIDCDVVATERKR